MSKMPGVCWEFFPFRLDITNAILWKGDDMVALRPKNFAALCHLVQRHGELVTKDELLDAVWKNRCVSEGVLKVCVNELRQALGDQARTHASGISLPLPAEAIASLRP